MTFKVNFFIIISLLSLNVSATERWAIDCSSGEGSILLEHKKADVIVNSNQIVVSTKLIRSNEKIVFFLEEPTDLGRGGMMLNWDAFSNDKPIASAKVNGDKIEFSWNGFFDKSTSKYVWVSDSEFTSPKDKNYVVINKCN